MKKRILVLCLALAVILSLSACGKSGKIVSVNETEIGEGVFTYYLQRVMSEPKKYGVKEKTQENIISAAVTLCQKYAVTAEYMKKEGITLSNQFKQAVATEVEALWSLYGAFYESVGVKKTDITKAVTHEYRMKQLVDYYYGAKGKNPVKEMDLKEEFVDLYVGFKVISAELTKINDAGEKIELTQSEKDRLKKKFTAYAEKINRDDATIDEVNVAYNDSIGLITTENLETVLIKKGDPMYGDGFFETIEAMSHGRARVLEDGNRLYLVQRQKIATTDEDAFYQYRSEVLEEIKMPEIEKKVKKLMKESEADVKQRKVLKIYDRLEEVKSK